MDTTRKNDVTHSNLERNAIIRLKTKLLLFNLFKKGDRIGYVCMVPGKGVVFSKREAGNLSAIKAWITSDIAEYKKNIGDKSRNSLTGTNRFGIYLSSSTLNHF